MKPIFFLLAFAALLHAPLLHAQEQTGNISIHFAFDKYYITASDMQALEAFKQTHSDVASIIIDGYADSVGTDNYNYALSMKRCNAVKQALGYDASKTEVILKITAHGEKNLLFNSNPENRVAIIKLNENKKSLAAPEITPPPLEQKNEKVVQVTYTPPAPVEIETPKPAVEKPVALIPKEIGKDETGLIKQLKESKVGESIVLSEIHFEPGKHVFAKSSKNALNAMLSALKALPDISIEIQGHICCADMLQADGFDVDTKEFKLSINRAQAVYDFMIQNGIDASRLTYKGFGSRKRLVYPEQTDDDRNKNRRVEFLITKK